MSGFFGIFRPKGGSVDLDAFEQMRKATEREGFDGLETHVEEKIAMGHLMLRVSPEAKYDQQPLHSECGRYLLVGHFRLDYRDELGDKLGLIQSELELTPDSRLVMLAYQKWKDQCVHHIEGDWAFALYDKRLNVLFFAKDKLGYSALYYTQIGDELYFASDGNLFKKILKVDFQTDLSQLQRLFIPGLRLLPGTTLIKEILYLNAGCFMSIDSFLKKMSFTYWELSEQPKIKFSYDNDAVQEFQSILSRAIHSSVQSSEKTGIFLSSGIDSNTVAYFASEELMKRQLTLFSYTSCPAFLREIPEEKHERVSEQFFLERQLLSRPNIKPEFLDFANVSIGEISLSNKTLDIQFPLINTNTFWLDGILDKARQNGIKTILNAKMGNYTLSWNSPNYLLYLFLNLRIYPFVVNLFALKRHLNISIKDLLKNELLKPLVRLVQKFFKRINPFLGERLFKQSILKKYIAEPVNWFQERKYLGLSPGFNLTLNPEKLRKKIIKYSAATLGMKWYKESHINTLIIRDPTIDIRFLEFSFSQKDNYYFKEGVGKYLVKKMMKGLISDEILFYKGLFPQSYDISHRLKNDLIFNDFFSSSSNHDSYEKIIDYDKLSNIYSSLLISGDNIRKIELSGELLKNISLITCLNQ